MSSELAKRAMQVQIDQILTPSSFPIVRRRWWQRSIYYDRSFHQLPDSSLSTNSWTKEESSLAWQALFRLSKLPRKLEPSFGWSPEMLS